MDIHVLGEKKRFIHIVVECDLCGKSARQVTPMRTGDVSLSILEILMVLQFTPIPGNYGRVGDQYVMRQSSLQYMCWECAADVDVGNGEHEEDI